MGDVGQHLASSMGGLSWQMTYVALILLYVAIHYMFVSWSSQVLALPAVFSTQAFEVESSAADGFLVVLCGYLTQGALYRLAC